LTDPRVAVAIESGIAQVRLVRPDKRNALDAAMLREIVEAGEWLAAEASLRAVVLSGEGAGFCAGLDTSLFGALVASEQHDDDARALGDSLRDDAARAVRVWVELDAPVIAAVHGVAVGGGFQLALAADFRVVAPDARLAAMEIRWGIVPDMGGTQLLPRLVRPDVAKDLVMTGRVITGAEAHELGLVTRLADDPLAAALEFAHELAARNPDAVRTAKRLVDVAWATSFADGVDVERELTGPLLGSPNQLEAVRAELEQRAPEFHP
jgi:enoyl-CoA hydratase/carnithine racemase